MDGLSLPARVPSAVSFRLVIHTWASALAPDVALAPRLPLEDVAPPHAQVPIHGELAPVAPEPEAALRECPREGP